MYKKKIDILVLILILFLGSIYAAATNKWFIGKPLIVTSVFCLSSIAYLGFRKKKNWEKIAVATVLFGGILAFIFDFAAEYTNTWHTLILVFPYKILGVGPVDNILFYMLTTAFVLVFYEHFLDKDITHKISSRIKYALYPGVCAALILVLLVIFKPSLLPHPSYPYLIMGLAAITPPIVLAYEKPKIIKKLAVVAIYFFFFYFILELFAVNFNYWIFPGHNYIGWVTILDKKFPFEELFFFMMFYAASLVSYYEIFIDDEK